MTIIFALSSYSLNLLIYYLSRIFQQLRCLTFSPSNYIIIVKGKLTFKCYSIKSKADVQEWFYFSFEIYNERFHIMILCYGNVTIAVFQTY